MLERRIAFVPAPHAWITLRLNPDANEAWGPPLAAEDPSVALKLLQSSEDAASRSIVLLPLNLKDKGGRLPRAWGNTGAWGNTQQPNAHGPQRSGNVGNESQHSTHYTIVDRARGQGSTSCAPKLIARGQRYGLEETGVLPITGH